MQDFFHQQLYSTSSDISAQPSQLVERFFFSTGVGEAYFRLGPNRSPFMQGFPNKMYFINSIKNSWGSLLFLNTFQKGSAEVVLVLPYHSTFFPEQVYLWGSLLQKNRLDTLLGALGLVGRGFGPAGRASLGVWQCWARWLRGVGRAVGWAWGLAVLGTLAGLGVGWPCWARWLGWAWCWACWARWLGWAWCWAWGLAVLGSWLGWAWGWAWCWAWGLGALAGLGVVLGVGFGRAGRAGWVGRGLGRAGRARGVGRAGRAGLGVLLGVGFGRAWRVQEVFIENCMSVFFFNVLFCEVFCLWFLVQGFDTTVWFHYKCFSLQFFLSIQLKRVSRSGFLAVFGKILAFVPAYFSVKIWI